ncbi:MAG: patatin-like phospholipase family protein [Nitrospira sp.]|nr:patatin-like phospholipase family protein [Nitrospira sp.]
MNTPVAPPAPPLSLGEILMEEIELLDGPFPDHHPIKAALAKKRQEPDPVKQVELDKEVLVALRRHIHGNHPKRAGLCLSGGGIRSATFGLGVLQSLAKLQLLDKFDYLSTVSGGGYIGSWLTAWMHRHPEGVNGVMDDLSNQPKNGATEAPPAVRWLRNYSNYLTPHLGFFSADSWTLLGIYLRNLTLNWMVLLPLLIFPLLVPRLMIALTQLTPRTAGLPDWATSGLLIVGLGLAVMALIYLHLCRPALREFRRDPWQIKLETQSWFLRACLAPLILSVGCLTIAWAWYRNGDGTLEHFTTQQAIVGGAVIHTGSWLFSAVVLKRFKALTRWLVLETLAVAGTGAIGGFFLHAALAKLPDDLNEAQFAEWFAFLALPAVFLIFLLTATLFIGVASRLTEEQDREWWGRTGSWMLIVMITWMGLSGIVIFGPGLLHWMTPQVAASVGGLSGLLTLILGFSSRTTAQQQEERSTLTVFTDLAVRAAAPLFMVCVLIALALGTSWQLDLLAHQYDQHLSDRAHPRITGLGIWTDPWGHDQTLHNTPLWLLSRFSVTVFVIGFLMSVVININRFSLHAMYRNRLIRAYLGASRNQKDREQSFNPFTGFDNLDNPSMSDMRFDEVRLARWFHERETSEHSVVPTLAAYLRLTDPTPEQEASLRAQLLQDLKQPPVQTRLNEAAQQLRPGPDCRARLTALQVPDTAAGQKAAKWLADLFVKRFHQRSPRLLHVINIALNLVKGDNLAWQQRKAQSFTISPLHSGSWNLGYRRSEEYGANHYINQPLSLGTALAISGAAASPNMGYHSSSAVTFLLALFNIRLGWWLGNPGKAGATTYRKASPNWSIRPLLAEAFGLTDSCHPYVYLSDGGHFENLGLYEMVCRRCHCILVVDAGCDPRLAFEDFGNAIRKIRIDLGIDIEINLDQIARSAESGSSTRHHAIGMIRYDKVDDNATAGTLVYLKPSLTGSEPTDVLDYAARHPGFPHEPTSDQFFDEAQFESYRRLGEHIAQLVLRPALERRIQEFSNLCHALRSYWMTIPPGMQESFLGETDDLKDLERLLRDDPDLLRYDLEIYPELCSVFGIDPGSVAPNPRAALHTCNLQIQLMEQVYLAVKLEDYHGHALNRGWMNLFRRWTCSATFRLFWPTVCSMYSQQFVRFAEQHFNLSIEQAALLEPLGTASDLTPLFRDLSIDWSSAPDYAHTFMHVLAHPLPLEEVTDKPPKLAAWQLRLPALDSQTGPVGQGEILAVVAATRLSVPEHRLGLYGWVRPAYRGLRHGHRLFGKAIEELIAAYPNHNLIVDLGPIDPAWAGTSIRNVGWLRFYEQLGFTRDRSNPDRFQMTRVLK